VVVPNWTIHLSSNARSRDVSFREDGERFRFRRFVVLHANYQFISHIKISPPSTNLFKMMVVIQPDTPGQKSLPCTVDELRKIKGHVAQKDLVKLVRHLGIAGFRGVVTSMWWVECINFRNNGLGQSLMPMAPRLRIHSMKIFSKSTVLS
jgi:hypothetical protein